MARTHILVVEDEKFIREDLEQCLEYADYTVTTAEDGAFAWKLLQENSTLYNTIILDRMMPNMSGMELLSKMRANPRMKNIPVIFQTAMTTKQDIVQGLNAGAYYYLPKPYELKQLLAVVQAAVLKNTEYAQLRHQLEKSESTLSSLSLIHNGSLEFQLQTKEDVIALSTLLAYACPDREDGKRLLYELLINAVEHGNLRITYQDKTRLLAEDRLESEIEHRLRLKEYNNKRVRLTVSCTEKQIQFRIEDDGDGFVWEEYLDFAVGRRAFDSHGRGIAICNHNTGFSLQYEGKGNIVTATCIYMR